MKLFIAFVLAFILILVINTTLIAQQDLYPQTLLNLSYCNEERGKLQRVEVARITGQLLTAQQVLQKFELANPGKTLDEKFKVVDKSK